MPRGGSAGFTMDCSSVRWRSRPSSARTTGCGVWEDGGEDASVPGITVSAQRVDELLSLLVEHRVSPTALADVVADWL